LKRKWIEAKMTEIGVLNNPKYKITACKKTLHSIEIIF
jgi:hypothetical protein